MIVGVLCVLASPGGTDPSSLPGSVAPCVPCHNRGDRNQVAEWLASPYSETEGGRGCTDCHHQHCSGNATSSTRFAPLAAADSARPIETARLTVRAVCSGDDVTAEVAVSNVGVGHALPTGSRERTLTLEVAARDRDQVPLPLWDDAKHRFINRAAAGLPGRAPEISTLNGASVTVRPRLLPFATDVSRYRFVAPESGPTRVSARLVLVPATGPASEIANKAFVCKPSGDTR